MTKPRALMKIIGTGGKGWQYILFYLRVKWLKFEFRKHKYVATPTQIEQMESEIQPCIFTIWMNAQPIWVDKYKFEAMKWLLLWMICGRSSRKAYQQKWRIVSCLGYACVQTENKPIFIVHPSDLIAPPESFVNCDYEFLENDTISIALDPVSPPPKPLMPKK